MILDIWIVSGYLAYLVRESNCNNLNKTSLFSFLKFVFLTYILGLGWLGIFGFSAVPVFLFYNMWTTCGAMKSPIANLTSVDNICVDVRQYGKKNLEIESLDNTLVILICKININLQCKK